MGIISCGGFAGSYGPNGLIGDNILRRVLNDEAVRVFFDLINDEGHVLSSLANLKRLTTARDRHDVVSHKGLGLLVHVLVRLAKVAATLRVADNAVRRADGRQHVGCRLTGVRALLLPVDILSAKSKRRLLVLDDLGDALQVDRRRAYDDIDIACATLKLPREPLCEHDGTAVGLIHLPVAGNHWLTHQATPPLLGAPCPRRAPSRRRRPWRSSSSCRQGQTY